MFNLGTCEPNPGTMNKLGGVTHRGIKVDVGVTHLELDGDELFDERVDRSEDMAAGP